MARKMRELADIYTPSAIVAFHENRGWWNGFNVGVLVGVAIAALGVRFIS